MQFRRRPSLFDSGQTVQLVLTGNEGVGKSTFLSGMSSDSLQGIPQQTIGVDLYSAQLEWIGSDFFSRAGIRVLQISGDRQFLSSSGKLGMQFMRECEAFVFCVDLTNLNSMASFKYFIKTLFFDLGQRNRLWELPILIVATKPELVVKGQLPRLIGKIRAYFSYYFQEQPVFVALTQREMARLVVKERARLPKVKPNYWTKWAGMGYYEFGQTCCVDLLSWFKYLGVRSFDLARFDPIIQDDESSSISKSDNPAF